LGEEIIEAFLRVNLLLGEEKACTGALNAATSGA
jgi:hypothetical protein